MNNNFVPSKPMFILPSLFTLANLGFGYYGIISAINENWLVAGAAVSLAAIMDGLDGRIARLTKTTSEFGLNFDSIVDMISFGVAPALVIYLKWLKNVDHKQIAWILPFIFISAGAFRLARFNADSDSDGPNIYFKGLPIPAAAGMLCTILWVYEKYFPGNEQLNFILHNIMPYLLIILSFLMVSNIKYYSFKKMGFLFKNPFIGIVSIILFILLLAFIPSIFLFAFALTYTLSGPVKTIFSISKVLKKNTNIKEVNNNGNDNN
jgi:CDP-diacylglycerol--serine O-phosphatidyltransferase